MGLPPLNRPMDETNAARLCAAFKVETPEELPRSIQWSYRNLKVACDRTTISSETDAFFLAVLAKAQCHVPEPETTLRDYISAGLVERGDSLRVKFRGKWENAVYLGYRQGKVRVDMAGDVREIDQEDVRLLSESQPPQEELETAGA